jgi:hypothetical protein
MYDVMWLQKRLEYRQDPLKYFIERLGVNPNTIHWSKNPEYNNHKWDGDKDPFITIMDCVKNSQWVGIESGTGVGKTYFLACLALWFLENWTHSLVVTTAPKRDQLQLHIWKEIQVKFPKFAKGTLGKGRLQMVKGKDNWQAIAFVAGVRAEEVKTSATKAQGFHAKDMLIIMEETAGINEAVITAFQNTADGKHNIIIASGNPDHEFDTLHKFCKRSDVKHIRISEYDYPNVVMDNDEFVAGAASKLGIKRKLELYKSETNPLYLSRVRGISPKQNKYALIQLDWIYRARDRDEEWRAKNMGIKALGVDVANSDSGDEAAIAYGDGAILEKVESMPCPNANQFGEYVYFRMNELKIKQEYIGVDGIGVGAGTVNKLKEFNVNIYDIQSGSSAIDIIGNSENFNNLRSQMWWQLRLDLQNSEIALPDDEELFADILTPQWTTKNGKIIIEPKEEIRKRLGRSPNKGDACVYWNWVRKNRKGDATSIYEPSKTIEEDARNLKIEYVDENFSRFWS